MGTSAKPAAYVWSVVVSCCLLSSCTHWPRWNMTPKEIPALAERPAERIPLRAGFFMDERFKEVIYNGRAVFYYQDYFQDRFQRSIDFDVRTAFEQATQNMFQEVVPVLATETSKDWKAKNLDVVVFVGPATCEVELDRETLLLVDRRIHTTVNAEWSVWSAEGRMITSVKPAGDGQAALGGPGLTGLKEALVKAVDAHLRRVNDGIVMSAWWRDPSWKADE